MSDYLWKADLCNESQCPQHVIVRPKLQGSMPWLLGMCAMIPPSTSALPVQRCQWCTNCPKGACIPVKASCPKDQNCPMDQHIIQQLGSCFEYLCPASDCQMCSHLAKCLWTRHFKRSSELGLQGSSEELLVQDLTCSATPEMTAPFFFNTLEPLGYCLSFNTLELPGYLCIKNSRTFTVTRLLLLGNSTKLVCWSECICNLSRNKS